MLCLSGFELYSRWVPLYVVVLRSLGELPRKIILDMRRLCLKNGRFDAEGVLPYERLIGMCRWMGSHFHVWSDYNGVAFSIDY